MSLNGPLEKWTGMRSLVFITLPRCVPSLLLKAACIVYTFNMYTYIHVTCMHTSIHHLTPQRRWMRRLLLQSRMTSPSLLPPRSSSVTTCLTTRKHVCIYSYLDLLIISRWVDCFPHPNFEYYNDLELLVISKGAVVPVWTRTLTSQHDIDDK